MDPTDGETRAYLQRNPPNPFPLLALPDVLILHILSFIDLHDLARVAAASPALAVLSRDTVLHLRRIRSVGPAVLTPHLRLRPPRMSLEVVRNLKGLNVRARAGNGQYLGSPTSQRQYEIAHAVGKRMLASRVSKGISSRPPLASLVQSNILDVELVHPPASSPRTSRPSASKPGVSPTLAPALHLLKREFTKDELARRMRARISWQGEQPGQGWGSVWKTLSVCAAQRGDSARWRDESHLSVRLAIVRTFPFLPSVRPIDGPSQCPGVKSTIRFFESLAVA